MSETPLPVAAGEPSLPLVLPQAEAGQLARAEPQDVAPPPARRLYQDEAAFLRDLVGDRILTDSAKVIGCWLANVLEPGSSSITVAVAVIANATRSSDRTVENGVKQLVALGWLNFSGSRGRHANTYVLPIDPARAANPAEISDVSGGTAESFDWNSQEDILVPEQAAIAVYWNPRGAVVIRQESPIHQDEDYYVFVQPVFLDDLIASLRKMRDEALARDQK